MSNTLDWLRSPVLTDILVVVCASLASTFANNKIVEHLAIINSRVDAASS